MLSQAIVTRKAVYKKLFFNFSVRKPLISPYQKWWSRRKYHHGRCMSKYYINSLYLAASSSLARLALMIFSRQRVRWGRRSRFWGHGPIRHFWHSASLGRCFTIVSSHSTTCQYERVNDFILLLSAATLPPDNMSGLMILFHYRQQPLYHLPIWAG